MAMDEDKYQKELFGEFAKPKRFFPRISDLFPKADFERNVAITLTLDKLVFIAIGIVMLIVAVYALGVESGKKRPAAMIQVPANVPVKTAPAAVQPAGVQQIRYTVPQKNFISVVPVPAINKPSQSTSGKYTILAATFSNKDNALQEVRKLRLQGFDAMLVQKDSRFFACVGSYTNKASAQIQNDLKKVKRLHSDAYVRLK